MEDEDLPPDYEEANYSSDEDYVARLEEETVWPGVSSTAWGDSEVQMVRGNRKGDRCVQVSVGGTMLDLYADTGSKHTIITPGQYQQSMGKVVASDTRLRAWGSKTYLDVKGMFKTRLEMTRGAEVDTWVYVVDGHRPEALLGDGDAEQLGVITFNREGRLKEDNVRLLVPDMRRAGIDIRTDKSPQREDRVEDKENTMRLVKRHKGKALTDNIGCIKVKAVKLEYEEGFKPVQPPGTQFHTTTRTK